LTEPITDERSLLAVLDGRIGMAAKVSIRFRTVWALCLTTLLALCLSPLVSSASAGGYVTPLFARGQYSGASAGYLTMDTVIPYLDARNIDADVSVVTGWPLEHDRLVYNGNVYLSWDDLRALRDDRSYARTCVRATDRMTPDLCRAACYGYGYSGIAARMLTS
jgi:hypothetical protein